MHFNWQSSSETKRERSFTMLFVDWRFSVNVDTLICEIEKEKNVDMRTTSVIVEVNPNTKRADRPNQGCSTRKSQYYTESDYLKKRKHKNKWQVKDMWYEVLWSWFCNMWMHPNHDQFTSNIQKIISVTDIRKCKQARDFHGEDTSYLGKLPQITSCGKLCFSSNSSIFFPADWLDWEEDNAASLQFTLKPREQNSCLTHSFEQSTARFHWVSAKGYSANPQTTRIDFLKYFLFKDHHIAHCNVNQEKATSWNPNGVNLLHV